MKIYYLSPIYINDVEGYLHPEFEKQVKEHPEVSIYSALGFQEAFNCEEISDLGYIVVEVLND